MTPSEILGVRGTRVQVLTFDKASGDVLADQSIQDTIELDSEYQKCLGVGLIEVTDSDLGDDYDVQILDGQSRELLQQINKQMIQTSDSVGQLDKIFPLKFDIRTGDRIKVSLVPGANGATDNLKVHIAFFLQKAE